MTILDEIAARTRLRVEEKKKEVPKEILIERLRHREGIGGHENELEGSGNNSSFPFEDALRKPGLSFILEVKKASPSKGVIAKEFPYIAIAKEYEMIGADAISVLTEPYYFHGCDEYLTEVKANVSIPILRKDFIVDEYQIYEAKLIGADAILLICALLTKMQLMHYLELAHALGLSALVEAHEASEIAMAVAAGAKIIGINNRNLKDFTVKLNHSIELRKLVPENIIFVSESGIQTADDIKRLSDHHTDAVLIGETLMRAADKRAKLQELKGAKLQELKE